MEKSMALAGAYLVIGLLMHMIAFSRAQEVNQKIECTFDDNILSADGAHQGTVDPSEAFRWNGGKIPYFFKGRVTSNDKRVFYDAMKQIEDKTCFKFEENSREPREHHLEISVGSPSCASRGFSAGVGVKSFTKVTLQSSYQLADSSRCNWQGGILHELMHVLGVMHTQKRKDRDQHITINWSNVQRSAGAKYQYSTCEGCNNFGVGYDCASIMHYGTSTFGNGRGATMSPKSRSCKLSSSGSAFDGRGASESDWELLRKVAGTVCSDKPSPTSRPTRPVTPPPSDECRTVAGPSTGSECVFPFRFAGTTYTECTYTYSDDGRPWCSTKTDRRGRHIGGRGYYGTCASSCPAEEPTDYYGYDYNSYGGLEHSNSVSLEDLEDAVL
jgi:hypothetical protein